MPIGGRTAVTELAAADPLEVLPRLHSQLDVHFRELKQDRQKLGANLPVFALEHGLSCEDLEALRASVRFAVARGFGSHYWRTTWLPFVVYAAECGYDYSGNEFWPHFDHLTPGWAVHGDRQRVRDWFLAFATAYGGAIPEGAFAEYFTIIAWPITHAVLPVYLQRNLAQLLYEFRMGLTTRLLHDPEELGRKLADRAWHYTERFRIFCTNTSLLGHVASALLLGEGEDSPYLLRSTLLRVVDGLEREREAKFWLQGARAAASSVRTRGFQPVPPRNSGGDGTNERLPTPTDPQLVLRNGDNGWRAYAQLPDLSSLSRRLPHVYDELRVRRARVEGADWTIMARGRLATPGQEIRLSRWPQPDRPFVQLEDGKPDVNNLLRDQVEITRGPIWLFKKRARGLAVEVKGRLVSPGNTYYVLYDGTWHPGLMPGVHPETVDVSGASMIRLTVPQQLTDEESRALVAAGLSVRTDVEIRPVGIAASAWDGQGAIEWLVGEPGLIGIRAEQVPTGGVVTLAGERHPLDWPENEQDLYLSLEDLPLGQHELRVSLTRGPDEPLTEGSLLVTIRDPHVRVDAGEAGEGIRLLTSPARPTMSELWEPGAVNLAGPEGVRVDITVVLRSEDGGQLARIQRQAELPVFDAAWKRLADGIRGDGAFKSGFDLAESLELTVSRAGVGYASLRADRGFQPLRWLVLRHRDENRARLIDRTDAGAARVQLFRFERPLEPEDQTSGDVVAPVTGGLLRATAGTGLDLTATILLPTQPNRMFGSSVAPEVQAAARTPAEMMRLVDAWQLWATAGLPGDIFAQHQRDVVLDSITRALVALACGTRWAEAERRLARSDDPLDLLADMQHAIGDSREHMQLGRSIGRSFWSWQGPVPLLAGFADAIRETQRLSGLQGHGSVPRFLLTLAGRSGQIALWPPTERDELLRKVLTSPVLLRAARFAVLGTRLYSADPSEWGF